MGRLMVRPVILAPPANPRKLLSPLAFSVQTFGLPRKKNCAARARHQQLENFKIL
jgi:hypothetical protein